MAYICNWIAVQFGRHLGETGTLLLHQPQDTWDMPCYVWYDLGIRLDGLPTVQCLSSRDTDHRGGSLWQHNVKSSLALRCRNVQFYKNRMKVRTVYSKTYSEKLLPWSATCLWKPPMLGRMTWFPLNLCLTDHLSCETTLWWKMRHLFKVLLQHTPGGGTKRKPPVLMQTLL